MVRRPALRGVGGGRGGRSVKLAVVDLGTNTCRLLLGEVEGGAVVRRDARETHVVRLGQGVDQSGRLDGEAAARTRRRLADYAARIDAYAPERRLLVATSVLRDAADGAAFLAAVEGDLGLPYRVIGGEEEALLAFRGATAGLGRAVVERQRGSSLSAGARTEWHASQGPSTEGRGGPDGPLPTAGAVGARDVVVVDIGGGSTELILARNGLPLHTASIRVGVVHLSEKLLHSDPPSQPELLSLDAKIHEHLDAALADDFSSSLPFPAPASVRLIGTAGTITTLAAIDLKMTRYEPDRVTNHVLSRAAIGAILHRLAAMPRKQRTTIAGLEPGREDLIIPGAALLLHLMNRFGFEAITVSDAGLLEGILIDALARPRTA